MQFTAVECNTLVSGLHSSAFWQSPQCAFGWRKAFPYIPIYSNCTAATVALFCKFLPYIQWHRELPCCSTYWDWVAADIYNAPSILLQIMLPLKTALSPIELSVLGHRITATDIGSENYTLLDRNIAWVEFWRKSFWAWNLLQGVWDLQEWFAGYSVKMEAWKLQVVLLGNTQCWLSQGWMSCF